MNPSLFSVSPVDGRYADKTKPLRDFFSEYALIKYRVRVEVEYFIALVELPLPQLKDVDPKHFDAMRSWYRAFTIEDAEKIKATERTTNHDVKAVEYFLKEKMESLGLEKYSEFIHFGLTSQDINNTAIPLSLKEGIQNAYAPLLNNVMARIEKLSNEWSDVPMLARTHGQPASPTLLGKEFAVFLTRLAQQYVHVLTTSYSAKFGGATGNFNAHYAAYPDIDWNSFANGLVEETLELTRSYPTTQIEHYDDMAALFDALKRINTILTDFARDVWQYIAMEYFRQKTKDGEVGSSAMPHKVNPIDFENAEGNLGLANAIFEYLSAKLPISRLQRDLTDSTVLRNIGVPIAHTVIALESLIKGMDKLVLNRDAIEKDLNNSWAVVAEAIQTVLRREGYPKPYEALKDLTRGKTEVTKTSLHTFIDTLNVTEPVKAELKNFTPFNYTGRFHPDNYDDEERTDGKADWLDIE
ncbi:MAG TPA: adenylosuccinate lyase [Chitinophagales bacterium]|nr:adenylosuccinate lyase [Chitinophagales bacterium]